MKKPLVSIIVPTYNVEKYIEECIDSILKQTYKNIEVLVIDDGSTDATAYLLKQYEEQVQVTINSLNHGQGAVRNQGIKEADGKYILFVDADDWIEPTTVETLIHKALTTDADLVRFNGQSFFEGDATLDNEGHYDFSKVLNETEIYKDSTILPKVQKSYSASPCLYLVKKELLTENDIQFSEGILHEDEYFSTKVFLHTQVMTFVNQFLYHRRYRVASTMTESTPNHKKKSFESYLKVFKLIEDEYFSDQYNEQQKAFLKRQLLSIYNGLQQSPVELSKKKKLNNLKSLSFTDKLRVNISRLKLKYFK